LKMIYNSNLILDLIREYSMVVLHYKRSEGN